MRLRVPWRNNQDKDIEQDWAGCCGPLRGGIWAETWNKWRRQTMCYLGGRVYRGSRRVRLAPLIQWTLKSLGLGGEVWEAWRDGRPGLQDLVRPYKDFPGGSVARNQLVNAGDTGDVGSIRGSERSSGGGNGNPLQFSCLKNPMYRGAWRVTDYGVAKSWTWLSDWAHRLYKLR